MAKRRRICCVVKSSKKNRVKKVVNLFDSIQNLNEFREKMKVSRKFLEKMWNNVIKDLTPVNNQLDSTPLEKQLDFTPVLNFKSDFKKVSTRQTIRRQRAQNRDAYFYKPKRKLAFGKI